MKRSDIALAVVGGVRVEPATSSGASVRTNKTAYSTKSGSYTMTTSFSENIRFGRKKKEKKEKKQKSSGKSADGHNSEDRDSRASRASVSSSSSFMRRRLSVSTVGSVTSSFHAPPPSECESTDQNPQMTSESSMSEQSQARPSGEEREEQPQQQQDPEPSKSSEPSEPSAAVTQAPPQPPKFSIPSPPGSPALDPCDRPISDVGGRRTTSDAACKAVDGRLTTMPQLRAECRSESSAGTGHSGIRDNIRPASPAPGEEKIENQHYMTASKGSGPIIITNGALPPPKRFLGFRHQTYVVAPESPTQAPVKTNSSPASPSVSPPTSPVLSGSASTTSSNDDRLAGLLRNWRRRERDRAVSSDSATTSTFKKAMEDVPEVVGPYPVFGVPLEQAVSLNVPWWPTDILAEDNAFDVQICDPEYQHFVPLVVLKCIKFIVRYGLDEEGIFRISGSSAQVAALRERFIKDGPTFELTIEENDIHGVASLLKQYLRQLPDDVLPIKHHEFLSYVPHTAMWETSGSMRSASAPEVLNAKAESADDLDPNLIPTQLLQEELRGLPYCSFALLHVMVRHLKTIVDHSDKNLMNVTNLAVVFSPCLRINKAVFIALLTRGDALWKGLEPEGQRPDFSTTEGPADFVQSHTTNTNDNNHQHHDSDDGGSKTNGYYYDALSSSSMATAVTVGQTSSNHGALADFDFSPNYSPRRARSPALSNSTNNDKGSVRSDESVSTARSSEAASVTSYSYEGRTSALDDPEVKTSARDRMRFLSSRLTIDTEKSNRLGRDKRTQSAKTPRTLFLRSSANTPTQSESQPRSATVATSE